MGNNKGYCILESDDETVLALDVEKHMRANWQPQGGVSLLRYEIMDRDGNINVHWWYAQAMVKHVITVTT